MANAFAKAFIEQNRASNRADTTKALAAARDALQSLDRLPRAERRQRSAQRQDLAGRVSQLQILSSLPGGDVVQLDSARPPAFPSAPQPKRSALFGFALSLMLGVIAAYALDRIDRRIRQLDDVMPIYDAPLLATIPRASDRPSPAPPPTIPASLLESFRTLRTSLGVAGIGADVKTLLITSAVPREGKSTVVRNLALAYRLAGKRVLVLEADLRRPTLGRTLCTLAEPGLTDVLNRRTTLTDALHEVPSETRQLASSSIRVSPAEYFESSGNGGSQWHDDPAAGGTSDLPPLTLLPSGAAVADPPRLFAASEFHVLLEDLARQFDIVLIDSPPLLSVSDALPLLSAVDATVLVSRVGTTSEESAKQLVELVGRVHGTRLLGVIANDVPAAIRRLRYLPSEYAPAT
jgi:Mrp family chromosome partitioning ATPase